jgi:ArsR family transcriptional regulator, lead/cadmium/zinc/bismuth-responsive transcriptional repressor
MKTRSKPSDLAACDPTEHDARAPHEARIGDEAYERAAGFFRAAGELARLKLLVRLGDGEWCVTELAQAAHVTLPTVSQQLRLLRAEGLVKRRRVAKHVYYALADEHIRDLLRSALEHASEGPPAPDED